MSFAHALVDGFDIGISQLAVKYLGAGETALEYMILLALLECFQFLIKCLFPLVSACWGGWGLLCGFH